MARLKDTTPHGVFRIIPPPVAEPGELERERARLIGKKIVHSALVCADVVLEEGTVWAVFRGDDAKRSYRWYARTCVVIS